MDKISGPLTIGHKSASSFKSLSKGISFFVIGVGCLVLIGWALDIPVLKSILPWLATMKSMTASLFVLCGISLWLQTNGQARRVAQVCAFIVALVGLLTLGEYLFKSDFNAIDQLPFPDPAIGTLFPGRMAPSTSLNFLIIGFVLLFLDNWLDIRFKQTLLIIAFAISMLALIGYLYGVSSLYQISLYTSMAVHSAISFTLLSLGILFARPERGLMQTVLTDTAGGKILRRFLPTAILLPIALGWIRLMGQRAGLYDTAFGLALMVSGLITLLTIFIWVNANELTSIDIKRRQLDASLQASELRLHSSLEEMMEGCQILGYDWRYLYINVTAEKHNQRPNSELMGNVYMDMWPGIEETALFPLLRHCMEERTPQRMLNEFTYPNGSLGWFELTIQPVPDGIFILSSDVTNHKRAEMELLEREKKLSLLFEILPVGISILDAERKVSYTNPAMKKILDISDEQLLKGTYQDLKYRRADGTVMPADEMTSARAFREKREIDNVEMGVVKDDGGVIWTNVSAVPVDFPDWKLVIVISDITDRKRAQSEILKLNAELEGKVAERTATLAQANALLQTMMDNIPDHIFFKDREGRFIRNSKSQTEMLGLSDPIQAIGKTDFDFFPHAQRSFDEEQEVIRSGKPLIGIEESVAWPDGHKTWLSTTKVPLRDQNGQIIGTFGIGRDITDHKHAEVALQKAKDELEIKVAERTIELRKANDQLQLELQERKQAEREILKLNTELDQKVAERTSELAMANEQLQELSIVDELTGLYNRRGFLLLADQQLSLARRVKRNLLVFYADLDGLKQINDSSGHTAGDYAILGAAHALQKTFRTSDIKARLGGDEFIVLAVEAEEHSAPILLARLHERLAEKNQAMSVGVVICDAQNEISIEDLIAHADEAMYTEKRGKPGYREI